MNELQLRVVAPMTRRQDTILEESKVIIYAFIKKAEKPILIPGAKTNFQ